MYNNSSLKHLNESDYLLAEQEIVDAILQLSKNKSRGVGKIYAELLLFAAHSVTKLLRSLFNAYILHECVPELFALSVTVQTNFMDHKFF